jgi:hypothetical protein
VLGVRAQPPCFSTDAVVGEDQLAQMVLDQVEAVAMQISSVM